MYYILLNVESTYEFTCGVFGNIELHIKSSTCQCVIWTYMSCKKLALCCYTITRTFHIKILEYNQ
uniref:Uncharacterized protein n=1 Tax=Rhizophora mucronata TaxID=61149 RepID=A0A2P2QYL8_RHIMU